MKTITLLGSTGSIGTQALDVAALYPQRFRVYAISAGRNIKLLGEQARRFKPNKVAIADPDLYSGLKTELAGVNTEIMAGDESILELASLDKNDIVLNALVGFAGLGPTLAALRCGKRLALANKESLVAGGHLVMPLTVGTNAEIIPVDSEHSAIFQCLQGQDNSALDQIILTASGGPFFGRNTAQLAGVRPEDALKHPNWQMGAKITIDSATMMNKGLEVIEAYWLFSLSYDKIKVVTHRESIIHSLIEYTDGAVLAQLGAPDMRVPIQYALTFPERLPGKAPRVNWEQLAGLHFNRPDEGTFPCLRLAYQAGRAGGSMPAVMNAANEVAVELFLAGVVGFLDIPRIIDAVMNKHKVVTSPGLEELVSIDAAARATARKSAVTKG
jgi:1-deoxy-D-xylulose-5-phosphate reductoisomerase